MSMLRSRNKIVYGILIMIVIFLGLASRRFSEYLPTFFATYLGDTLWALMIFLCMGFLFKRVSTILVGVYALMFSILIEISQLYHATWIDHIRSIKIGGLILGHGFLWSDLVCYTVGIGIGGMVEKFVYDFKNSMR